MRRPFHAAVCPAKSQRLLWRVLAVSTLASTLALTTTGTEVHADATAAGSVQVSGLSLPIQLSCPGGCSFASNATSTGDIAGIDGTTPFEAVWSQAPFSTSGGYVSTCLGFNLWQNAMVTYAGATISAVTLTYGTTTYTNASVSLSYQAFIVEGAFAPLTLVASISGGPSQIAIPVPAGGAPGAMALTSGAVAAPCPGATVTITATGTFLTLG